MAEIVFDEQTIKYVALFQDLTRTTVIDCVDASDKLIFVVKEGDIGKAIGKKGENIAKLKRLMNRTSMSSNIRISRTSSSRTCSGTST